MQSSDVDGALLRYVVLRFHQSTLGQAIGLLGMIFLIPEPLAHFTDFPLSFIGLCVLTLALLVRAIQIPIILRNFDSMPQPKVKSRFYFILLWCAIGWSISSFSILISMPSNGEAQALILTIIAAVGIFGSTIACYSRVLLAVYVATIWSALIGYAVFSDSNTLMGFFIASGFFVYVSGLSSRKNLEAIEDRYLQEHKSRVHFHSALNAMPIRLLILNPNLQIRFVNDGLKELIGIRSEEEIKALRLNDISKELDSVVHRLQDDESAQFELKLGNEKTRWQLISIRQLEDSKEIIIAATDIDERKRSEQRELELRAVAETSTRLAVMGQVAAGIAHEINNPLAIIIARIEKLMEEDPDPNSDRVAALKKIDSTAHRIAKIVRSVRSLGRDGKLDPPQPIKLSVAVDETLSLFEQKLQIGSIELRNEIAPEIWIYCRQVEIVQILTNLLSNAIDAVMLEDDRQQRWITIKNDPEKDGRVSVKISNGGPKIREEVAKKLGTPFFTTKPVGSGTGLGFAIAQRLSQENGGDLQFDPSVESTCFVLTFPVAKRPSQESGGAASA